MNKEEAAQFLGITVRTLQRHMAAHRIGFEMRRTRTGEEAVFSPEELERFKAARACGQTMSGFTVSTLLRSASDILEQHQNIHLSDQDRDRFLAAIDSSPQPNQALRRAAERYKRQ